jgi:hypothetical protein
MTAEGPRKGEPSRRIVRHGLRTQPASSVRGSSRRIMAMRFRPAYISVINRRASAEAVISPAVQNKNAPSPPAGSVIPPEPPIEAVGNARTVLAGKGSLRRAKPMRALACCTPFRPDHDAMGGSGGITGRSVTTAKNKTPGLQGYLTGSLHISSPTAVRRGRSQARSPALWWHLASGRAAPGGPRASRVCSRPRHL